jgi:hypothetical protein
MSTYKVKYFCCFYGNRRVQSVIYYKDGNLHRVDGPAIIYSDGSHSLGCEGTQSFRTQIWCQNDKKHRVDGPAIIYSDGTKHWYLNDECKIVSCCLE